MLKQIQRIRIHVPAQQSEAVFFQKRLLFLDVAKPAQQSEAVFL